MSEGGVSLGGTDDKKENALEFIKKVAIGDKNYPPTSKANNMTFHSVTVFGNHAAVTGQPVAYVWLPQRVLEVKRCYRIPGSTVIWNTLAVATPAVPGVPLIGTVPSAMVAGGFVPAGMSVTMNANDWFVVASPDQNLSLKPDVDSTFVNGFPIGGIIKIKSDATNNTSNALSGTFSYGCLSTVGANNLSFAPPNLVQESISKKSAALNVPCAAGIVTVTACDFTDEALPFKVNQNTGFLNKNSRRYPNIFNSQLLVAPAYGAGTESLNAWNPVDSTGNSAWISPFSQAAFGTSGGSSSAFSFVGAPCSMFDVPAFEFDVSIIADPATPLTAITLGQPQVGVLRVIHYFFQSAIVGGTSPVIGGNWTVVSENLLIDNPSYSNYDPAFANGGQSTSTTAIGPGFGTQKHKSIPQLPDGYQWFGTYVHCLRAYGSEASRYSFRVDRCDQYLQNQFEKGRNGPIRVIRADNVAQGQNINVSGTIWFAASADKAVAPYVESGTRDMSSMPEPGVLELVQTLYDTPEVDGFKRIMTETEFDGIVATLANATPDQVERYLDNVTRHSQRARRVSAGFFSSLGNFAKSAYGKLRRVASVAQAMAPKAMNFMERARALKDGNVGEAMGDLSGLVKDVMGAVKEAKQLYRETGESQVVTTGEEAGQPGEFAVVSGSQWAATADDDQDDDALYGMDENEEEDVQDNMNQHGVSATTLDPILQISSKSGKQKCRGYLNKTYKEHPGIFITPRVMWRLVSRSYKLPMNVVKRLIPLKYMYDAPNKRMYLESKDDQDDAFDHLVGGAIQKKKQRMEEKYADWLAKHPNADADSIKRRRGPMEALKRFRDHQLEELHPTGQRESYVKEYYDKFKINADKTYPNADWKERVFGGVKDGAFNYASDIFPMTPPTVFAWYNRIDKAHRVRDYLGLIDRWIGLSDVSKRHLVQTMAKAYIETIGVGNDKISVLAERFGDFFEKFVERRGYYAALWSERKKEPAPDAPQPGSGPSFYQGPSESEAILSEPLLTGPGKERATEYLSKHGGRYFGGPLALVPRGKAAKRVK